MLANFASLKPHLKLTNKLYSIDNLAFKLHYRVTFVLLLACTVLVTSRQYIGEHIRCFTEKAIPENVLNTFCFFTTTFTVIRHYNETLLKNHAIHPGVGPMYEEDPIKHHAYYQWVPFVLFLQAIMFHLPHKIWRSWENGKIKALVDGLDTVELFKFNSKSEDRKFGNVNVLSRSAVDGRVTQIKVAFLQHMKANRLWALRMVTCEIFNLANVIAQVYLTHLYLQRQFFGLGVDVVHDDFTASITSLDKVFPKMTKCHFHKFGASGSIQTHDALCVMALNVINEKIFTFLWFWYIVLFLVSVLALIWRLITLVCHSRSSKFNSFVFSFACPGRLDPDDMEKTIKYLPFSDWLFLYYLAKNIHAIMFRDVIKQVSLEIDQMLAEEERSESNNETYDIDEQTVDEIDEAPTSLQQPFVADANSHRTFKSSDF